MTTETTIYETTSYTGRTLPWESLVDFMVWCLAKKLTTLIDAGQLGENEGASWLKKRRTEWLGTHPTSLVVSVLLEMDPEFWGHA